MTGTQFKILCESLDEINKTLKLILEAVKASKTVNPPDGPIRDYIQSGWPLTNPPYVPAPLPSLPKDYPQIWMQEKALTYKPDKEIV